MALGQSEEIILVVLEPPLQDSHGKRRIGQIGLQSLKQLCVGLYEHPEHVNASLVEP